MYPQHLIARKRDGAPLSADEIAAFVRGATDGSWADYQLSAMLMAMFLKGMAREETAALTSAMAGSGVRADLKSVRRPKADKHSTGGVGDKISIPLAPMVAACGVAVPMMSGRGLGHTGGTLDKLESIPGFSTTLTLDAYRDQVERIGLALIGQTADLAPADRKLYALRDVTATVESIPLICASILSKKVVEGTDVLVADVKFGRGAFIKEKERSRELARTLVEVAAAMGLPMRALLSSMDQPLGHAVGNSLEIEESIACLRGKGPEDVMELTFALGEQMLMLAGVAHEEKDARKQLEHAVASGAALDKFAEVIAAQGGDAHVLDEPGRLPRARAIVPLASPGAGWVRDVDPMAVALAVLRLGGGRRRAEDAIDPAVGVSGLVKVGDEVDAGQPICLIHANDDAALEEAKKMLVAAVTVGGDEPDEPVLIHELIG